MHYCTNILNSGEDCFGWLAYRGEPHSYCTRIHIMWNDYSFIVGAREMQLYSFGFSFPKRHKCFFSLHRKSRKQKIIPFTLEEIMSRSTMDCSCSLMRFTTGSMETACRLLLGRLIRSMMRVKPRQYICWKSIGLHCLAFYISPNIEVWILQCVEYTHTWLKASNSAKLNWD